MHNSFSTLNNSLYFMNQSFPHLTKPRTFLPPL
jgi:hypothetical protein